MQREDLGKIMSLQYEHLCLYITRRLLDCCVFLLLIIKIIPVVDRNCANYFSFVLVFLFRRSPDDVREEIQISGRRLSMCFESSLEECQRINE